ncbi:hypothetical protein MKX03_007945 [Papaver bracteatum]|nr:hypothetical protein MKX03_007945 [Papaver bracteatum]
MATISASQFVSRINCGGTTPKDILKQINMKNQSMTHSGLRSLSKIDFLQIKNTQKAASMELRRNAFQTDKGTAAGEVKCSGGMNLVFVAAEVGPWSKTGGLGDVLGGLPPAMAANGHRVMTVSPRYDQYKDAWDTNVSVEMKIGDKIETVRFFHCYKRGVDRVFVDHPLFLEKVWGKTGSKIYGPNTGSDYQDNQLRFCLLSLAALEAPRVLNLNSNKYFSGTYGEEVVFIANDWHTALLPCYLKSMYQSKGMYETAKVAYCIHNIAYQGRFSFSDFALLNLPDSFRSSFDFIDGYEKPIKGRKINWMKAGILEADKVVTVSVELDSIIRKVGCLGIINGMDIQEWNPLTDKYIDVKYDASTHCSVSRVTVDRNIPVIGFIGRLEEQKGSDILAAAIPEFIDEEVQIIVLGTGKKPMEKQLDQLETLYPEKARGVAKFNVPLAHMIIAGADFMMIPSRFEPCGLIQLHAMRYGTVPIVASTGGLVDTVKEGFTGFQMGAFNVECEETDPLDATAIATTTKKALETYGTPALTEMIQNCMAQDLSWKGPAKNWEDMLLGLEVAGSEPGIEGDEISPLAKENIATP